MTLYEKLDTLTAFTFHYVSIKSSRRTGQVQRRQGFTFHYVSIKSCLCLPGVNLHKNLHSTMYLLNRDFLIAPLS